MELRPCPPGGACESAGCERNGAGVKWRGVERNARARAPFMVELRCVVDAVQGSKGEAGAAMGCPYGRGVAVDACGVVAWSGGQWRSGGVGRPRAAVAHGPGRKRPLCRGGGAASCVGRVASKAAKGAAER